MKIIPSPLFKGFSETDYLALMDSDCVESKNYRKAECLLYSGEVTEKLGIVLNGSVNIETIDLWGNRNILANITKGDVFAETYAIAGSPLMVDVIANEDTSVLFLNAASVYKGHYADAPWRNKLINNLLMLLAKKNLARSLRTYQISFKKSRPRISSYLSNIARQAGSNEFDIPFDRQELADYLNLDRSALSKELMHMKRDGLLDYHKNHFSLKKIMEE